MNQTEFLSALSAFLSEKQNKDVRVEAGTDLLGEGLIDSIVMVEILMLIEGFRGEPVDADALEPELFERAERLYQTFFTQKAQ